MQIDVCELKLSWIELPAGNAWHAIQRAAEVVEAVLPELLRTRNLRADARMPDDRRRPAPPAGHVARARALRARRRAAAAPAG